MLGGFSTVSAGYTVVTISHTQMIVVTRTEKFEKVEIVTKLQLDTV